MLRKLVPVCRNFSTTVCRNAELEVSNVAPGVAHVQLNRPDRRNTYTIELWRETKEVFERLTDDSTCRAIVLSGIGKSFCAGIDLEMGMGKIVKTIQDDSTDVGRKARKLEKFIAVAQDGFHAIEKCPKPVIAAVHSHCIGAGVDMITSCDIRYAAQDSIFSIREVDIGMAADIGTLQRIEKVVGSASWVRELAFTARDFGSDEALKHGLISRVFDSNKECVSGAIALATLIAQKSPIGVQGTKKALVYSRDHTAEESLEMIKYWNMSQLLSSDLADSAIAAMKKKKAQYKDIDLSI